MDLEEFKFKLPPVDPEAGPTSPSTLLAAQNHWHSAHASDAAGSGWELTDPDRGSGWAGRNGALPGC
eukprot:952447-Rhodomonas_salina.1